MFKHCVFKINYFHNFNKETRFLVTLISHGWLNARLATMEADSREELYLPDVNWMVIVA